MNYLLTGQEMKACDAKTITEYKVPAMVLMERAALSVADVICSSGYDLKRIGIVCGMGNNGGDGLAVARILHEREVEVQVFLVGDEGKASLQTLEQLAMVRSYTIPVRYVMDTIPYEYFLQELALCSVIVDGIFGVGLSREIGGFYKRVLDSMNACPARKVAIDIPSGVDAGTGQILGTAFRADMTVTFAFHKLGLVLYPGAEYTGKVYVASIGITKDSLDEKSSYVYTCSDNEIRAMLPYRPAYSNKGTFGKVVLVVGSAGMAGAAYLAAMAAYKSGCGLVRIVTPEENRAVLQTLVPEAVITTYDSAAPQRKEQELLEVFQWATHIGIGSGLGTGPAAAYLTKLVLTRAKVPVVADGDALNLLAHEKDILNERTCELVITPHPGEMSRLTGDSIETIRKNLFQTAEEFAKKYKLCCVLKDTRTVVSEIGKASYLNLTGNQGMAVAGSGDVLMGMICGLAAQKMSLYEAAVVGVCLHGLAGDAAAERHGCRGMTARDILSGIADVLKDS